MIKFIGTAQHESGVLLYYYQNEGKHNFFKVASSHDGLEFSDASNYVFAMDHLQQEEQKYNWKSFRVAAQNHQYLLTYKIDSKTDTQLLNAVSSDLIVWQKAGNVDDIHETGAVVSNYQYENQSVMYFGEEEIKMAFSPDLLQWKAHKKVLLAPRENHFDHSPLEVGNAYKINDTILLTYYVEKKNGNKKHFAVGAAIFEKNDPTKLLWRSDEPLWEQPDQLSHDTLQPLGSAIVNNELILYWVVNESNIFSVSCQIPVLQVIPKHNIFSTLVRKFADNPIIAPRPDRAWESRAAFNSAALYEDGKVHFLYRALGDKDLSVLGYATSKDGLTIDTRSDEPAYIPREPFETPGGNTFASFAAHFASGGGYGGIEDPRITRVEDRVYLTYVAFDGATPPRAAMSSIHIDDFLKNDWDKWDKAKLISAPGMVNKSAVVLPRKVRGKYVVMHRVYPNILVDYLDNLEFENYLQGHYFIPPRKQFWDSKKVGAGAPPIETKDGWLLIYQSVGYQDSSRYKIGAMMLDINNPEKVLYRTPTPIISPDEDYENNGFKAGVVYPCGAAIVKDKLHIYYGGADTVVCAATTELDPFLDAMKHNQEPKLRKVLSTQFN